jgi:hypothetical protein
MIALYADIGPKKPESDPIEATFELNDTLYAKAHIPHTDGVYLWLGVRLSFTNSAKWSTNVRLGECHAVISHR